MDVIELAIEHVFGLHKVAGSWCPLPYRPPAMNWENPVTTANQAQLNSKNRKFLGTSTTTSALFFSAFGRTPPTTLEILFYNNSSSFILALYKILELLGKEDL